MTLEEARAKAIKVSKESGAAQHVEVSVEYVTQPRMEYRVRWDGYHVSDWFTSGGTVESYVNGERVQ